MGIHQARIVAKFYFSTHAARNLFELWQSMSDEEVDGSQSHLWTIARDVPEWYKEQLGNVVKIKNQKTHGGYYFDYVETGEDHAHDLEVMGTVAAAMSGFIGAESMEGPGEER